MHLCAATPHRWCSPVTPQLFPGMPTDSSRMAPTRRILITGVGMRGQVGEAVAAALAAAGDHVLVVERTLADAEARVRDVVAAGGRANGYAADLSDPGATERLARDLMREHGERVDAVVHLAGGWLPGATVAESSAEYWERSLAINLLTAAYTARAFLPAVRNARGAFVFFSSEAALPGGSPGGMAAYAAAKQGVIALMRAIAQEERSHGVRANAVAPAAIRTASNEARMGADARYVEREDVARTVQWLCSDAARAVSGEVVRLSPIGARPAPAGTEQDG
jgi:NAD(P)-dependent dehydrogenase (short-subunit alcohol dehydrogenase family)